ncbi:2-isopropylmalate synthase [Eubacteriales bacterium OttesenSCG-928-G02]|nr:2-isopropylmalate synthase [Eubacteriales bacterium OttesenSCG-928-G02]
MDNYRTIKILDTTLRDGEQMPGVNLNASDKLRIAHALSKLGVDVIEAGFPASSDSDFKAVYKISEQIDNTIISALARADKKDIDSAYNALKPAKRKRIHIFIAASDIHLEYKLKISRNELLKRIDESVKYAKTLFDYVQFSPEDASRADKEFLFTVLNTAIQAGADMINIPDTVGYSTPFEFGNLIKDIKNNVDLKNVDYSVHCHNDLGLATANSLSAIENGVNYIECTVNGLGERAGNASLEEVVMALKTREQLYKVKTNIKTELLYKTSQLVSSITGIYIPVNKVIVGKNVFLHESGIHQHGVLSNPLTYEIMKPEAVGINESEIVLGKHSGRHAFNEKLEELELKVEKKVAENAFIAFKNLSCRKKSISDDDIKALVEEAILDMNIVDGFDLANYQTQSGNNIKSMAMVTLSKGSSSVTEAATGEGPIEAAFNAINKITNKDIKLVFYNIKSVTGGTDALGEVRVIISIDDKEFIGKGVSTDIIESSIKAYISAINRSNLITR